MSIDSRSKPAVSQPVCLDKPALSIPGLPEILKISAVDWEKYSRAVKSRKHDSDSCITILGETCRAILDYAELKTLGDLQWLGSGVLQL
jgi:hypothetical protein